MDFLAYRQACARVDNLTGRMLRKEISPIDILTTDPPAFSNDQTLQSLLTTENWLDFFCLFYPEHLRVARVEGALHGQLPSPEVQEFYLRAYKWRSVVVENREAIVGALRIPAEQNAQVATVLAHVSKFLTFASNIGLL